VCCCLFCRFYLYFFITLSRIIFYYIITI
jgi:hypothetical protein